MKKLFSIITAAALVLSLSACSSSKIDNAEDTLKFGTFNENTDIGPHSFLAGVYSPDKYERLFSLISIDDLSSLPIYEVSYSDSNLSKERAEKIINSLDKGADYTETFNNVNIAYSTETKGQPRTSITLGGKGDFTFTAHNDEVKMIIPSSDEGDTDKLQKELSDYIKAHKDIFTGGFDTVISEPAIGELSTQPVGTNFYFFKKQPKTADEMMLFFAGCYESVSVFAGKDECIIKYVPPCTKKVAEPAVITRSEAKAKIDKNECLAARSSAAAYIDNRGFCSFYLSKPSEPYYDNTDPVLFYAPKNNGKFLIPVYCQMRYLSEEGYMSSGMRLCTYAALLPAVK